MSAKIKGPLHQLQLDGDGLKIEVDELEKNIKQLIEDDDNDATELNKLYQSCIDLKMKSSDLLMRGSELQQLNETTKIQNFHIKKNDEIQRIKRLQASLNILMDKIELSSNEVEHLRSLRHSQEQTTTQQTRKDDERPPHAHPSNQEEEEEYSEEEGEEEEYEDDEPSEDDLYEVIHPFQAETDGDLAVALGDVVSIVYRQDDGWWKVKNQDNKSGMVPSNFLQEYEEEEEDDEEEESALQDDTGVPTVHTESSSQRRGKDLWKGIKDAVNEPVKTDVTDVLAALGAIPGGFRPSTLGRFNAREEYTLKNAILPAFTESNNGLKDLQWDPALNQIRALPTRVLRSCRLWSCRMIPLAGSGVEILSRHIRLALFNGTNVVSNVHTVRASCAANSPKLWTFSPRVTGFLPSLLDGDCIVRSDITHSNLGILFELGITYIRAKTGEQAELSSGWVFLKLFDEQGNAIPNKTYELPVNGGTPFEKGVEVDPSISRRASTSRFRNLLTANKQPKLIIKLGTPDNTKKKILNLLPANILLSSSYCELVSYYRRILADAMIRDRLSVRDADPIPSPVLSSFPVAIMETDLMDALRSAWVDKTKSFRRGDKRDKENIKSKFKQVFLETTYVLLHSATLPKSQWAKPQVEQERWQKIYQHLQLLKAATTSSAGVKTDPVNAVLKSLLSSNVDHPPFDMDELNFTLANDHKKSLPAVLQ